MREYVVEYLGSVFFFYVTVVTKNAFAIGAALALAIYVSSNLSGGGFNPAVTLAHALTGDTPMAKLLPYVLAHVAAALTVWQIYIRLKK